MEYQRDYSVKAKTQERMEKIKNNFKKFNYSTLVLRKHQIFFLIAN